VILTIGHSRHPIAEFLELLKRHGVEALVDVRRKPYSRREPQFNREALATALVGTGVQYLHLETLGGMREPHPASPHVALPASVRGFADYMESAEFHAALDRLIKESRAKTTAIMCAEAAPSRCHRSLIADALMAHGEEVAHIVGRGPAEPHQLTAGARVEGDRVSYPAKQARLDLESE